MKASLFALLLAAACGGSSKPTTAPAPPAPDPAPSTLPPTAQTPAKPNPVEPPVPAGPTPDAAFLATCRGHITAAKGEQQKLLDAKDKRTIENTLDVFNELSRDAANAG